MFFFMNTNQSCINNLQRERRKDKQKLKQRKENDVPQAMLLGDQPARKRSKLVLPEPQVTDQVSFSCLTFTFIFL